jgi:hypothetical protein
MLKGVYLAPAEAEPKQASGITAAEPDAPVSRQDAAGSGSAFNAVSRDAPVSFDKKEALSIIARDIISSADVASKDGMSVDLRGTASPDDGPAPDEAVVSEDRQPRRSSARIITEDGVVASGDAPIAPEETANTDKRAPRAASEDAGEPRTQGN